MDEDTVLELAGVVADEAWQQVPCSKCHRLLPKDDFYSHAGKRRGRSAWCRDCAREYNSRIKHAPAPSGFQPCTTCGEVKHATEFNKNPLAPPTETHLAGRRRACKVCSRRESRIHEYGEEAVAAFEADAAESCQSCGTTDWGGKHGSPQLDHDHTTRAYRGTLCQRCNTALAEDSTPEQLRALADYLERSNKRYGKDGS